MHVGSSLLLGLLSLGIIFLHQDLLLNLSKEELGSMPDCTQ